jgi:hypothetical protein
MQTIITCLLVFLGLISAFGQETKSVLFIGNSYIYYNDMPETLKNIALSMGDNVIHDSSAPGGATLQGHSTPAPARILSCGFKIFFIFAL